MVNTSKKHENVGKSVLIHAQNQFFHINSKFSCHCCSVLLFRKYMYYAIPFYLFGQPEMTAVFPSMQQLETSS